MGLTTEEIRFLLEERVDSLIDQISECEETRVLKMLKNELVITGIELNKYR